MGTVQSNYMIAQLCAVVVNVISAIFKGKGQQNKTINPMDFVPDWSGRDKRSEKAAPAKAETVEDMKEIFKQLAKNQPKKKKKRVTDGRPTT